MVNDADSNAEQDDREESDWSKQCAQRLQDSRSAVLPKNHKFSEAQQPNITYLVESHRILGSMCASARHLGRDDVVSGSVDALSLVEPGVLLAPWKTHGVTSLKA